MTPGSTNLHSAAPTTKESVVRKGTPVWSGVLRYFPDAICAVARLSRAGNDKHNPGQPLHWSRDKSTDHDDCVVRHSMTPELLDTETGELHVVAEAWRALAACQLLEEKRLGAKSLAAQLGMIPAPVEEAKCDTVGTGCAQPAKDTDKCETFPGIKYHPIYEFIDFVITQAPPAETKVMTPWRRGTGRMPDGVAANTDVEYRCVHKSRIVPGAAKASNLGWMRSYEYRWFE